jgi:hypothetical protein
VNQPLEMLLGHEGADCEGSERNRRVSTGAGVCGEAEEREGREDEDELRGMRQVAVEIIGGQAEGSVRDRVPKEDARSRERQRQKPGQSATHILMMPVGAMRRVVVRPGASPSRRGTAARGSAEQLRTHELAHDSRIRCATGLLHHLADEEAEEPLLATLERCHLTGIRREDRLDHGVEL